MKITIFGKKRKTEDGKTFTTYSTKLKKKDGTEQYASVKFIEDSNRPKYDDLPLNIIIPKEGSSLGKRRWESEDGEKSGFNYTLFIEEWEVDFENPFVDHSLDDYE